MKRILLTTLLISLIGLLNITAQERIYTPALSLPVNGAVDQMPDVVLDWDGVTGGNTGYIIYDIQIDTDPDFPNPVNLETELLTAVQTANLLFGATYYWRVRARDGNDVSDWSETWSFRVIRRVILTNPAEASTQNDIVNIIWSSISGITEYDYQFDTIYFWKPVSSGQDSKLFGISVVDENHAWVAGASGLVLFYDGASWVSQASSLSTDLYDLHFLNDTNGWAVGKSGKIIYYNGTSWTAQTSGTTNDLNGIYMLDATHGWAVGKSGTILYFNGNTWSSEPAASKDLNEVFATDASHVWAVGKSGLIVFYDGTSWSVQETGSIKDFSSVFFASANDGWVVGKTGFIMHYSGVEWSAFVQSATTKNLTSVYFTDPANGYAVGEGGAVIQFDGVDWSSQSATVTTNFNDVGFSGSTGFIVGETGTVIAYNDEAFTSPMATIHHVSSDKTTAQIVDLLFGTQYYWRMRAKHSLDISTWSGARSFNTRATVTLDKPNEDATDQNLNVLLKWKNQMSSRVSYDIQVDDDPAFVSPIFMSTDDVEINAELLKFGVEYNWRVRAMHAYDTSEWCPSWKFTTINSIILESPADNETDVKLSPLLTWEALTGIEGYQVLVSSNNSFADPIVDAIVPIEENSYIVPLVLDKDAQYYWRVRAVNVLDTSGWSSTWSFKTMPPVGIDEPGLSGKIDVYPNPANNTVYIQLKDKDALSLQLTINDIVGKKVLEKEIMLNAGNKNVPLDVSFLQNGIYMLRMADKENIFTKKLFIKR